MLKKKKIVNDSWISQCETGKTHDAYFLIFLLLVNAGKNRGEFAVRKEMQEEGDGEQ